MEIISLPLSESLVQMASLTDCFPSLRTQALAIHVVSDEAAMQHIQYSMQA